MTTNPTTQPHDYDPKIPDAPRPATAPRNIWGIVAYVIATLVAIAIIATIIVLSSQGGEQPPKASNSPAAPLAPAPVVEPTPEPTVVPLPTDFVLTVTEMSKQCFGSAGCSLTFRIDVTYNGQPLSEEQEFTVLYTVLGDEGGPQKNSFTLRGTQASIQSEESASTRSSNVKLTAKVSQVLP